ncbi:MAG: Arabinose efflux permease-like protein [Actinomycetia bacterium]|nr:Arabinose efflux permease-like protein [Actinomycetes bacterium]
MTAASTGLAPAPAERPPARAWPVIAALAFAGFAVSIVHTIVIPLMLSFPRLLNSSPATVSWLVTATLLTAAVSTPLFGRLGDQFGRRRMLFAALTGLLAGSLVCALTSNAAVMIAGRALQGTGIAALPLGMSIIGSVLPPERRGAGIALLSSLLGAGGAVALPISGVISQHADFHLLFWLCAAVAVVAMAVVRIAVPSTPVQRGQRADAVGAVLLVLALLALLVPLAQGRIWGWSSPLTLGLFAASVALLVLFTRVQLRRAAPLVDVRATVRRPILLTNLASVLMGFALYASFLGTASFVEAPRAAGYGFGASLSTAALCLLPGGLLMLPLSPVTARISARWGPKVALVSGALVVASGYLARVVFTASLWQVVAGACVISAGTGIAYASMPALIMDWTPARDTSAANGLNALARHVGTSLSSAAGSALLGSFTITVAGVTLPAERGYLLFFGIGGAAALAAATVAVFVPPTPGPSTATPGPDIARPSTDIATAPQIARSLQLRRRRAGSAIAGGS